MSECINIAIRNHVAEVTLDRASKLNALDLEMFSGLGEAAESIANDPSIRAVVLSGAGGNFSAGIDLAVLSELSEEQVAKMFVPIAPSAANFFQRAAYAWRELAVPVICAIEGVTFGGGLQIALGADVRYASKEASFSIMESKWGLIPDMGLSTTLRHLMSPDQVKELAWSARVIDSAEAKRLGLVTAVVEDPQKAARQLAAECVSKSPDAIRGIKALVNHAWQVSDVDALGLEVTLQRDIIGKSNQVEAVMANIEKRRAKFHD